MGKPIRTGIIYSDTSLQHSPSFQLRGKRWYITGFHNPHLILVPCVQAFFEHMWTVSFHNALCQGNSVLNYSTHKGILAYFCHLLHLFAIFLLRVSLLLKEKVSLVPKSPPVGKEYEEKQTDLDLLVHNNRPALEEKVGTGWCSPSNVRNQSHLLQERAVSQRLHQTIKAGGCNCS